MIRMDNAGENRLLQKSLKKQEFDIDFQYTAAVTPQQNGRVEQKIATLWQSALNIKFGKDYTRDLLQAVGWVCRSRHKHWECHRE